MANSASEIRVNRKPPSERGFDPGSAQTGLGAQTLTPDRRAKQVRIGLSERAQRAAWPGFRAPNLTPEFADDPFFSLFFSFQSGMTASYHNGPHSGPYPLSVGVWLRAGRRERRGKA